MNQSDRPRWQCLSRYLDEQLSPSTGCLTLHGRWPLCYCLAVIACIFIESSNAAHCLEDRSTQQLDASVVRRLSAQWEQAQSAMFYAQWSIAKERLVTCLDLSEQLFPRQHWCRIRLNAELAFVERAVALNDDEARRLMKAVEGKRQSLQYLGEHRYADGIAAAREALQTCEGCGFSDTIFYGELRGTLGRLLLADGQYELAGIVLLAAIRESTALLPTDDVVVIAMQMRLGEAFQRSKRVYEAERHYRITLDGISKYSAEERLVHRGGRRLEYACYLQLSCLLYDLQDYEMAMKTLNTASVVRNRDGDVKAGERIFEMLFTGLASVGHGESKVKIDDLRQLVNEIIQGEVPRGLDVDDVALLYTELLLNAGRMPEANVMYSRLGGLLIDGRSRSGSNYCYLTGMWHAGNSRFEEALVAFQDSVNKTDRDRGETHPELIRTLREYIRVAEKLGRSEEAMRLKQRLELCEERLAKYKAERAKWLNEKR